MDFLPFSDDNDKQQFIDLAQSMGDDQRMKCLQQCLHRCISQNYITEYSTILPRFLPSRLGCGSLLSILIEKNRSEMFAQTWKLAESLEQFHSQLLHIYHNVLLEMAHWTDVTCVKQVLTSSVVGRMTFDKYQNVLRDVFYKSGIENNTELFVYLLEQIDHGRIDPFDYCPMIEHKNLVAVEALLRYADRIRHAEHIVGFAWKEALHSQDFVVFERIVPLSNPSAVLSCLKGEERDALEDYIARQQAQSIEQHICGSPLATLPRKI